MKTKILDLNGKGKATIDLPSCFSKEIREDIVARVLEIKKKTTLFSFTRRGKTTFCQWKNTS